MAGQAQNGTNTTVGTATPASSTGSAGNTSALVQNGSGGGTGTGGAAANQSGGSGSANGTTGSSGSSGGGARGNTGALLDGNTTWGEYANSSRASGANGSGNASGNASANQSSNGSGGGGVLGTVGSIAGGAYDLTAGVGDFLTGGTDEWFGKTVSGFFNGARSFFGWMFGFFIEQGAGIIENTIDKAVRAFSMTPHPNNVGNFYQNPSNAPWGTVYDTFQQTGLPLARLMWLASLAYLMIAGNQFGAGTMSYAKEKQAWVGLAISVFFVSDAGWTLTNLVPHVADVFTQSFTQDVTTTSVMDSMAKGMVVLFVLLLIYFELSAVVLLMAVAAFRLLVIVGFAPFIPALVVAMYSPFGLLSFIAKAGIHLWLVLLVAAIPSTLLLDATFSMAQLAAGGNFDLLGTVMVIPLIVGGLLASALMPFLLWKASSSLGSALGVNMPGSESGGRVRQKMSEYQQKAARPNRFQRGLRRKDPVTDGGTGAHRAGRATRDAPRNAKQTAESAGSKARNAPSEAKDRAANMKSKLSRWSSQSNGIPDEGEL
ncbi:hypothetical protein [Halococcus sp. AFM35]|uniref:hypothetical protein n=1 Tax=Halococcus sp. AFM35 TaxID=3421653 RepID=UPI003EC071A8